MIREPRFQAPWVATAEDEPLYGVRVLAILRSQPNHRIAPVVMLLEHDEGWMLAETPAHRAFRCEEAPLAWAPIPNFQETK